MGKVKLKTFLKKFTACVLVAAMTVSTPLTAFAAEFSDFFSISDGESENDSDTGTVSSTHSGTNTEALRENEGRIKGFIIYDSNGVIVASKDDNINESKKIVMVPGKQEVLTAVFRIEGGLTSNVTPTQLYENIRWRSTNPTVVAVDAKSGSMNKCPINAKQAGTATVTASLDINRDGKYDWEASVQVEVFEPSVDNIRWNITDTFYVKHTYCLSDYLQIGNGDIDATDVITFAVNGAAQVATISGDMLTIKKAGDITLLAVLPDGTEISSEKIKVTEGNPVKKLTAYVGEDKSNKVTLDFGKDGEEYVPNPQQNVSVLVETKNGVVENDENTGTTSATVTTDDIIWTTNNPSVATVEAVEDQTKAVITATDGIGKATITAKSTSGKTAKFNVTVKATLISINSVTINGGGYAWSGKTEELIIDRTPVQNRDKFKVTSSDKLVKTKSTANNVTITPANDLKLAEGEEGIDVTLTVAPSDKNLEDLAKEATITVMQSDVEIKKVSNLNDGPENAKDMNKQTIRANRWETYDYGLDLIEKRPIPGEDAVSWVSSNVKVATVNNGHLEVVGEGTAKITVSSIYKNKKDKYVQSKETFTVKSTPICEGIVLKSNAAVYDLSQKKPKAVTINIKQQLPQKANDEIEWYVNGVKQVRSAKDKNITDKKITIQPNTFKSMKVEEGDTVEVMAVSTKDSSVYAVATIYVVKPAAKKVAFKKKEVTFQIGGTKPKLCDEIEAPTVTGSKSDKVVSYTVDKKGASIVKAEKTKDGVKLTAVGAGKATVTAFTASGKKATLKVTVTVK